MTLEEAFHTLREECCRFGAPRHLRATRIVNAKVIEQAEICVRRSHSGLDSEDLAQRVWANRLLSADETGNCSGIRRLCKNNKKDYEFSFGVKFFVLSEHKNMVQETTRVGKIHTKTSDIFKELLRRLTMDDTDVIQVETDAVEAGMRAYTRLPTLYKLILAEKEILAKTLKEIALLHGKSPKSVAWAADTLTRAENGFRALFMDELNRGPKR